MTKGELAELLLECELEFEMCESHWGSDYTDIRARLKAAAAETAAETAVGMDWQRCYRGAVEECQRLRQVIVSAYRYHHQPCDCPACRFIVDEESAPVNREEKHDDR